MFSKISRTSPFPTTAACLDAVAAISKVLAYGLLRWDEATLVKNLTGVALDYQTCRGMLEAGEAAAVE